MPRDLPKSPVYVIAYAAIISAVFTFAIMALHVASEDRVRANEKLLLEKAIVDLFGLGDGDALSGAEIAELVRRRVAGYEDPDAPSDDARRLPIRLQDPASGAAVPLLVAFRDDLPPDEAPPIFDRAQVLSYAFPIRGQGFWAPIEGWLAVTPDLTETVGVVFTRHSETPGLGGRITEPGFREQFRPEHRGSGRGLVLLPSGGTDVPALVEIDHNRLAPSDPGYAQHIVAITGATGTSDAVERFLNRDTARFYRAARQAGFFGGDRPLGAARVTRSRVPWGDRAQETSTEVESDHVASANR
jgi:Na+-transporting NADH:ubiquinone oxidoreductase subunit C